MRKPFTLILAACLSAIGGQTVLAGPVSPGRALEIGQKFFAGSPAYRMGSGTVRIVWDGEFEGSKTQESPAFYVVARDGGGFVIVAGNDNVTPILGISGNGHFQTKDMPDNVRWWMERMKSYVRSCIAPEPEALSRWATITGTRAGDGDAHITGTVTDKIEHLTPEWNQGNTDNYYFGRQVFNVSCPKDNAGNLTITGCAATSLAELLTTLSGLYPEDMPAKGTGTVGGYRASNGYVVPARYELSTTYDWENLRTLTGTNAINQAIADAEGDSDKTARLEALLENLGQLLADCGAIVQAQYSVAGTSASTGNNIVNTMGEHFSMSKISHAEYATSYSPTRWKRLLKSNLRDRPLFYSGATSDNSGHAFLLDGYGKYDGEDVFHVNFGWSGACNGYYFIDRLDTGDGNDFSDHNVVAILDFFPDARNQTSYPTGLALKSTSIYHGFTIPGGITAGSTIAFTVGRLENIGKDSFSGQVRTGLKHRDTVTYFDNESGSGTISELRAGYGYPQFEFRSKIPLGTTFSFGDRIGLYYTTDQVQMIPVSYPKDGTVIGEIPLFPAAFIETESVYQVGDWFSFRIMNHNQTYAGTVWTITEPDGTTSTVAQSEQEFELTQTGRHKIVAAIAPSVGADVVEHVVTYITVR